MTNDKGTLLSFRANSRLQRSGRSPRGQAFNAANESTAKPRGPSTPLRSAQDGKAFWLRHCFGIGHSSPVILTVTRLALVLALGLAVSCSGKRITKANVDHVSEGMTKKQVDSILGPPTSRSTDTYIYRQGKDTVTIIFKADKVQSKDSTLSD